MSASADDFFHKVGRSTATTLSAPGYTIGDTSINVASTTNWPTSTGVTFAIDETDADGNRISGTYNVFRGTVSGATQVNNLTYVGGDANRNYAAAATTRVYILVSAYRDNRFTDGVLVEHNQDGTHGAVTATSVTAATINATTDLQQNSVSLDTIRSEIISDFVADGGVVAQSAGLVGTFSDMVHYINGVRCTKTSVPNKTYTASKDTYVDADATNNSTVTYTEVANGAASPSLTAGNIRVAKVATNGLAITSVVQSGSDSLGNPIKRTKPTGSSYGSAVYSLLNLLPKQSNTTNTGENNVLIQHGWGFMLGSGSNASSETVTLPTAYDSANYIVVCSSLGYKGSDPTSESDATIAQSIVATAKIITSNTFTMGLRDSSTAMGGTTRFLYSWIAIGVKA